MSLTANPPACTVPAAGGNSTPGAATSLEITRTAGATKEDKLVVHFAVVPADTADPKTAFEGATAAGSITIPMSATA